MHLRLSSCIGMPVVEEGTEEEIGFLSGALIHPDTGVVEGFFVRIPQFFSSLELFVSSLDVLRIGTRLYVSQAEHLSPAEDRIRLQSLLNDSRTIVYQPVQTQSGTKLGTCKDVQFNTKTMRLEWIFPKKFWLWGVPLPASEILQIKPAAIIVRNPVRNEPEPVKEEKLLEVELPETTPAT